MLSAEVAVTEPITMAGWANEFPVAASLALIPQLPFSEAALRYRD
jgi:hypothetical protein